jgi:hypothetical protein
MSRVSLTRIMQTQSPQMFLVVVVCMVICGTNADYPGGIENGKPACNSIPSSCFNKCRDINAYHASAGRQKTECKLCGKYLDGVNEREEDYTKTDCAIGKCEQKYQIEKGANPAPHYPDICKTCEHTSNAHFPNGDFIWVGVAHADARVSCARQCHDQYYYGPTGCTLCSNHAGFYMKGCGGIGSATSAGTKTACSVPAEGYYTHGCQSSHAGTHTDCVLQCYNDASCNSATIINCAGQSAGQKVSCAGHFSGGRDSNGLSYISCGGGKHETKARITHQSCVNQGNKYRKWADNKLTDDECVACKACEPGIQMNVGCVDNHAGTCETCKCDDETQYVSASCSGGVESARQCAACSTWTPAVHQLNDYYLPSCTGVAPDPQPCTVCEPYEYEHQACRHDLGTSSYDATKDRICKLCSEYANDSLDCNTDQYVACSNTEHPNCEPCNQDCAYREWIDGCVDTVGFVEYAGGVCTRCEVLCPPGQYSFDLVCLGKSLSDEAYCLPCNPFKPHGTEGPISSYLHTDNRTWNCEWECNDGYYRSGVSCLTCNVDDCAEGTYRTKCLSGATSDSVCQACSEPDKCSRGAYKARCSGATDADHTAVCTLCNQLPCALGYLREACNGLGYEDAGCVACGAGHIPPNSLTVSECDWICKEDYYRTQQGCVACTKDVCIGNNNEGAVDKNSARELCLAGQATKDAECVCASGFEATGSYNSNVDVCAFCTNYQFTDRHTKTCTDCTLGQQGTGLDGLYSTSCEPCPVNYYRGVGMTGACQYCVAGTGGQTGMSECNNCTLGSFIHLSPTWSGYVFDYSSGVQGSWMEYSGSTNIPRIYCSHSGGCSDEPLLQKPYSTLLKGDGPLVMDTLRWLYTSECNDFLCNTDGAARTNVSIGHDGSLKLPQYQYECTVCDLGNVYTK